MSGEHDGQGASDGKLATAAAVSKIAVMTCGGDCPGLNGVIRAVTLDAIAHDIEVFGVEDGLLGLVQVCCPLAVGFTNLTRTRLEVTPTPLAHVC